MELQVASKGWFVAMVATTVETANPEAEIQPGLNLLGPIKQKFLQVSDQYQFNFIFFKFGPLNGTCVIGTALQC